MLFSFFHYFAWLGYSQPHWMPGIIQCRHTGKNCAILSLTINGVNKIYVIILLSIITCLSINVFANDFAKLLDVVEKVRSYRHISLIQVEFFVSYLSLGRLNQPGWSQSNNPPIRVYII